MAAFPPLCESGFDTNALGGDIAETDTASAGAIRHITESVPLYGITPFRGAYCYIIDQSVCTTTECKLVSAACNVTATNYWAMGFAFYAKSTVMATGNRTSLVKLLDGATEEVCLQLYYTTAGGLQLLLTEASDTAVGSNPVCPITENAWHWIELYGVNDPGSNDGTAIGVIDGLTQLSLGSLNQGAITDMQIGLDDQDAGHTAGLYAFDDIYFAGIDTSAVRVGYRSRWPINPHISTSGHVFVGPGTLMGAQLITATSGDILRLYDTDRGTSTGTYHLVAEVTASGTPTISGPLTFERGCYAVISGTNPRGIVFIEQGANEYIGAPYTRCYGNEANLRMWAKRNELLGNR
jgi:hypothetical protein